MLCNRNYDKDPRKITINKFQKTNNIQSSNNKSDNLNLKNWSLFDICFLVLGIFRAIRSACC